MRSVICFSWDDDMSNRVLVFLHCVKDHIGQTVPCDPLNLVPTLMGLPVGVQLLRAVFTSAPGE